MKIEKSVSWISTTGKSIECKIVVTREARTEIAYADGYNVDLGKKSYSNTEINVFVDGKFYKNSSTPSIVSEPSFSAKTVKQVKDLGGVALMANHTLVINQIQFDNIMAAVAEATAEASQDSEYVVAKAVEDAEKAAKEANLKESEKRYAEQVKNGLCPKCGTYCYGDCTSR
jgi:hypothetical protein